MRWRIRVLFKVKNLKLQTIDIQRPMYKFHVKAKEYNMEISWEKIKPTITANRPMLCYVKLKGTIMSF